MFDLEEWTEKSPPGRYRRKWGDNNKTDFIYGVRAWTGFSWLRLRTNS
jgi:hypothetical protein